VVVIVVVCGLAAGCGQTIRIRKIPFRNDPKPYAGFAIPAKIEDF
jgi:hypothetical protein